MKCRDLLYYIGLTGLPFDYTPTSEEGEKDQSDQISKQEEENADFILFTPSLLTKYYVKLYLPLFIT